MCRQKEGQYTGGRGRLCHVINSAARTTDVDHDVDHDDRRHGAATPMTFTAGTTDVDGDDDDNDNPRRRRTLFDGDASITDGIRVKMTPSDQCPAWKF